MEKKFNPSLKVDVKQIVVITFILMLIFLTPVIVNYISNPNRKSLNEIFNNAKQEMKIEVIKSDESEFIVSFPFVNSLDLSILKKNPQVLVFLGGILVFFSVIIAITLIRNS